MTLPAWVCEPALAPTWALLRARVEARGLDPTGTVRVPVGGRDERRALGDLLGRPVLRDTVTVDLADLDTRLTARAGSSLLDTLTALGGPLVDRRAVRAARATARSLPLDVAASLVGDSPWGLAWVAGLRRSGLLTGRPDAVPAVRAAVIVVEQVRAGQAAGSRVELAARLLGDAHALDRDRLVHQLVVRALECLEGVEGGVGAGVDVWERHGIEADLVSRTCLVHRLVIDGALVPEPRHLTAWDLRRRTVAAPSEVLVCENPRVLEAVAETGLPWPVLCTSGEPNRVVDAVLARLDAPLRYHGDLDWAGVGIANRLVGAHGVRPWRMTADDFLAHVRDDGPPLVGRPTTACWDADLAPAMERVGRALHEETWLAVLLTDLATR